ncbi:hypothetical protein FSC37_00605 [Piscinibacter aquaticus]|uniref:Uncharacterized protein n=1 Tax=Piscinibacter aquaticus TaxID=392597 RepID=A0A5C6U083_9BURK|nr:hypothetical protein FSC37_00605 [Piscinibacter aquaticus]
MTTSNTPNEAAGSPPPASDSIDWVRVRSPQRDQDRVLQSPTHVWLRRIPSAIHPKHLCRYYPRIANRLAMAWGDKVEVEAIFEDLLQDRRGQRKGFSERVRVEIERLQRFHQRKLHVNYPPLMVVRRRVPPGSAGGG